MAAPAAAAPGAAPPACYVLVHALVKHKNIGMLIRSAVAFGATEVIVCGGAARTLTTFGAHGTERFIPIREFERLRDAAAWLHERKIAIVGVEITADARSVTEQPFTGPTAFILGNEGTGLDAAAKAICDSFCYIPQHGVGTASLNVVCAASIVLHHFAIWARMPEAPRDGEGRDKFAVIPPRFDPDAPLTGIAAEKRAARAEKRAAAEAVAAAAGAAAAEGGEGVVAAEAASGGAAATAGAAAADGGRA
jgi:tRNA(Leu) C34 or U34 (ribose-2'-O)-methylase TrmL